MSPSMKADGISPATFPSILAVVAAIPTGGPNSNDRLRCLIAPWARIETAAMISTNANAYGFFQLLFRSSPVSEVCAS